MSPTLTVRVSDLEGNETVATHSFQVDPGVIPISGDFGGLIASGEHGHITGNVNLTGDLIVEGLLTGIDTFTLTGNGFQLLAQDGGQINLAGVEKSGWVKWGDAVTGWQIGDRLGIAATKLGSFSPIAGTWNGSWASTVRPTNSPDVTLVDRVAVPEVANLDRSITLQNLRRIHFHDAAGVQTLKWLRVLNSGTTGVLADYPIHFHLNGEASRGSLIEGVVVEGGKNHAFVAHGSHGITFLDCVAYKTINDVYWWDTPPGGEPYNPVNDSHDITWQHCLAADVVQTPSGSIDHGLAAFVIGAGNGNRCIDSVATGVKGNGTNISGFRWRENFVWEFVGCVAHNIQKNGIYTWTNSPHRHIIDDFVAYHFGRAGIEHGAYRNQFVYRNVSLTVTNPIFEFGSSDTQAIRLHANAAFAGLLFENIVTDDRLVVDDHGLLLTTWTVHRNCQYTLVYYTEGGSSGPNPSEIRFEDCGLAPADFILGGGIHPASEIEIYEAGVLTHRWAGGWT